MIKYLQLRVVLWPSHNLSVLYPSKKKRHAIFFLFTPPLRHAFSAFYQCIHAVAMVIRV